MSSALALVSGATGGIGRAVVERLWQEGYSVVALGHTPAKCASLNTWFRLHPCAGRDAYAHPLDVRDAEALARCRTLLDDQLTLLVCCHGAAPMIAPAVQTLQTARDVIDIDVFGTIGLCHLVGPYMLGQQRGSIALVSSLHARQTYPERLPYSMAKSAISGLVRSLAVEWGPYGVRTNAVLPWQVSGPRTESFITARREATGEDLEELYRQRSPMRRLIAPEDIADAVLFLARNPAINGHELVLDGGVSASMWYEGYKDTE